MSVVALPQIDRRYRNVRWAVLTRAFCILIAAVTVAVLVGLPIEKERFHKGAFSDDFSADFDVNRTEYPLGFGLAANRTAHEIYLSVEGWPRRITLWQMR